MLLYKSLSHDPSLNLELEKRLLAGGGEDILLFYINSPSVIVGRNQSVGAEADTDYCRRHGIPVLQRISGGGTVYHDEGNINYSFVTGKGAEPLLDSDATAPITDALACFGVAATVGSRREILAGGFKISGTASYEGRGRRLFHGTLLHNADFDVMNKALRGNVAERGRKIASVPSTVVNLNTFPVLDIPTEVFLEKLLDFFAGYYGCGGYKEVVP